MSAPEVMTGEYATARRGGLDDFEIAFIYKQAAARRTATQISKMIGRNVEDVRAVMAEPPPAACASTPEPDPPAFLQPPPKRTVLSLWKGEIDATPTWTRRDIVLYVAYRHDMTPAELCGQRRTRRHTRVRWEAMWLMSQQKRWSLLQIAQALGGLDHTTVIHGLRRFEELMDAGEVEDPTPRAT